MRSELEALIVARGKGTTAWAAAITGALLLAGLLAPSTAVAGTCAYDSTTKTVTISQPDAINDDALSRSGVQLHFNGAQCGTATVDNTNTIVVTNAGQNGDHGLTIDLSNGPLAPSPPASERCGTLLAGEAEIEVRVDLGNHNAGDRLTLIGTAAADAYRLGLDGVNLNDEKFCDDVDITGPSGGPLNTVERFEVAPGAGGDSVNGSPANQSGPLAARLVAYDGGDVANDVVTTGNNPEDLVNYSAGANAVSVDLRVSAPQDTGAGSDQITGFENLIGSNFNDVLIGDAAANEINGSAGLDRIAGGPGDDFLRGGSGGDTADYSDAAAGVTVVVDDNSPQDTGGAGTDELEDFENLTGSGFGDTLFGDANPNVLDGRGGADLLAAFEGNDQLLIRDGVGDTAYCGGGVDSVSSDLAGVDSFPDADCEIVAFLPSPLTPPSPAAPPPAAGPTSAANQICAALRAKLKKAKTKKKKRKIRRRLRALGC